LFHSLRDEWEIYFAGSGREALELMEREPIDVVVSDMCMPGMSGAELLSEVMRKYPKTVRIILSGYSSPKTIMDLVGVTHQYLSKPCDAEALKRAVHRAFLVRNMLANEDLKKLLSQLDKIPSLPSLYYELVDELNSPSASIQRIGEIVSKDVAMTAKILQLVNSAFFGLVRHVSSPAQAVALLGLDTVKALVLSIKVFSQFDERKVKAFSIDKLWDHSIAVGSFARVIAKSEGMERQAVDDSFMAGLLHDVGKLVLADNLTGQYAEVLNRARERRLPPYELERRVFGATHAEVGAYLLGLWGLPDSIVEAVSFHHRPRKAIARAFSALTSVHVADVLASQMFHPSTDGCLPEFDSEYISALGLSDRLPIWEKNCRQIAGEDVDEQKDSLRR